MSRITPFLWFDRQAEDAANYYVSIFKDSKINKVTRYPEGMPMAGLAMVVNFELDGREFTALNGGPQFKLNEAFSLVVNCEDQKEIDYYWDKLTAGGKEVQCGWLKDKFGLSWQVVPAAMGKLMSGEAAKRVMPELMKMVKIDLATLERAAGKP